MRPTTKVVTEDGLLERMREICLKLPGSSETVTYGHPGFKVDDRLYAVLETYKGELSICVKVGRDVLDIFEKDPRYYRTPYIGNQGWVSLKVRAAPLDWNEVRELLKGSHLLVRRKRANPPRSRTAVKRKRRNPPS